MTAIPAWPPRSLPRLYVDPPLAADTILTLVGGQAHYLGNVMRLKDGAEVLLFDGVSGEWLARVAEAGKKRMTLSVQQQTRPIEPVPDLILAFAPIKRAQTDWLVEKATELGVARLQPVITRRTIVERVKRERMHAIAVEAAEQCHRTSLPDIADAMTLDALLKAHDRSRALCFMDEGGGAPALASFVPGPATILTGPEGGFTDDERAAIRATPGATAISLGPRILRAETAALAAVAAWMAAVGDWR